MAKYNGIGPIETVNFNPYNFYTNINFQGNNSPGKRDVLSLHAKIDLVVIRIFRHLSKQFEQNNLIFAERQKFLAAKQKTNENHQEVPKAPPKQEQPSFSEKDFLLLANAVMKSIAK